MSDTRALFKAAKGDAPSALAKAKIWGGIAATTAAGAAGAGASAAGGIAGGTGKLVALGALFGSAITVGLAMALIHVGATGSLPPRAGTGSLTPHAGTAGLATQAGAAGLTPQAGAAGLTPQAGAAGLTPQAGAAGLTPHAGAPGLAPGADLEVPAHERDDFASVPRAPGDPSASAHATRLTTAGPNPSPTLASAPNRAKAARKADTLPVTLDDDPLMRESLLVAEGRGALVRGDARGALSAVRAARAVQSHALEPEELSLEAKALRALGNETEAAQVEARLRAKYPDHALAR